MKATWITASSAALDANRATFAELPVRDLLGSRNYLDALRRRGYRVELSEGLTDETHGSSASPLRHRLSIEPGWPTAHANARRGMIKRVIDDLPN